MALSKKQIITTIFTLAIIFAIPIAVFLSQKNQTLRSKALQGKANFLLSTDSTTSTVGKDINVLVSLQLTDPALKVSGVDFMLLYDKALLEVGNVVPNIESVSPGAPFTDAPVVTSGGSFDDKFNFVRVTELARRPDNSLPGGTAAAIKLANITFRGRGSGGQATIKFPDDNKYLEVSGTGTLPSITPGGPTVGPSPTSPPQSSCLTTCSQYIGQYGITSAACQNACVSYSACVGICTGAGYPASTCQSVCTIIGAPQ